MKAKWSKGWPAVRERIRRTDPAAKRVRAKERIRRTDPAAEGVRAASQDLDRRKALTTSNTATNNAACAWLEAQEEGEEVGFPVRPQVPLRPMTYKAAFDLSFFLKEKGGLDGLIYSKQRQDILDL
uniref:Protein Nef n=1 Tax=Human immunodeficiency virus type 1 TaxID=11676 RepID=A0A0H3YAE4_HV1|nr:truncated nef protein [Human immunodeficiency virus 1]